MTWNNVKKKEETLEKEEFFRAGSTLTLDQGLKVLVWGDAGVGKSYFALSAPPPIYVLDTEFGTMPVVRHFKDKEIYVFEAAILDPDTDEPDAEASLKKIERALATLKDIDKGTIVLDSGTDIWGWLGAWVEQGAQKKGKMTSIGQPQRLEWSRANTRWRQLILRLMAKPVHFVITAQPQEEYSSKGEAMGIYKPRIQKQTEFMCDIILHIEKEFKKGARKPVYKATLTKCRFQRGLELTFEDVTFDGLCEVLDEKLGVKVRGVTVE